MTSEIACQADADCPAHDGLCLDPRLPTCGCDEGAGRCDPNPLACDGGSDCFGEEVCIGGHCAEPGPREGSLCNFDEHCPAWMSCRGGGCTRGECTLDGDCAAGQDCDDNVCAAAACAENAGLSGRLRLPQPRLPGGRLRRRRRLRRRQERLPGRRLPQRRVHRRRPLRRLLDLQLREPLSDPLRSRRGVPDAVHRGAAVPHPALRRLRRGRRRQLPDAADRLRARAAHLRRDPQARPDPRPPPPRPRPRPSPGAQAVARNSEATGRPGRR